MMSPSPTVAVIRALGGVSRERLPAFLGIGAQKAGTTWLFENLRRHPSLFLPPRKELHYFDKHYDAPLGAYAVHFASARGRVFGEITPAYGSLSRERIRFVRAIMPDVRLVFLLRNPIDRAWSQAVMELARRASRGAETLRRPEVVRFFESELSVSRSRYVPMLDAWMESFPAEQLLVCFFDDIQRRPRHLLQSVFRHVGVSARVDWKRLPHDKAIVPNLKSGLVAGRFARIVDPRRPLEDQSPPCPDWAASWLERRYASDLDELERRFGRPVTDWRSRLNEARRADARSR